MNKHGQFWRFKLCTWTNAYSTIYLCIFVLTAARIKDGHVKLHGGSDERRGNVLIWHNFRWGSVCDDEWTLQNAEVVCRQLGFPRALKATEYGLYGQARRLIWLDNVVCEGHEESLANCSHDTWEEHDCSRHEAAGVICAPGVTTTQPSVFNMPAIMRGPPPPNTLKAHEPYDVRLRGGRNPQEGRVEVNIDGAWGVVCGYQWAMLEAMVVCKQLGFGFARSPVQADFFGGDDLDKLINGVKCTGDEATLADCFHLQAQRAVVCPQKNLVAGVICTPILPDLIPNVTILEQSMYLKDHPLYYLQCSMEENCLAQSAYTMKETQPGTWHLASRRLLRFSSSVLNNGTSDFKPNMPKEDWEWHLCHMHYHSMDIFAHYDIIDYHGNRVAQGHKASFCLEDVECLPGYDKHYSCTNYGDQGISVGCADRYNHDIDCQWIDMTDTPPGEYLFKLNVNPNYLVGELDYSNNAVLCNFNYTGFSIDLNNCTIQHGSDLPVIG